METSLEVLGATARAMQVSVPPQQFAEQVEQRLRKLARTLRVDGFRPGKVPLQIVRQRHLADVHGEVVRKLTETSLQKALAARELRPVAMPEITVEEFGEDRPLKYAARFDVYPELESAQVAQLELKDPQAAPSAEDVAAGMERLREQHQDWHAVPRPAAAGDRVHFDFAAAEAEPPRQSGSQALVLQPPGELPEGFARELTEALTGMREHEAKPAPEAWRERMEAALAEAEGPLQLRVSAVREASLPDWDDAEFLRRCGGETREAVHDAVQAHLEQLCAELRQQDLRAQIVAGLTAAPQPALPVPASLQRQCRERVAQLQQQLLGAVDEAAAEQEALRDARLLTAFEALRTLSGAEPTEEERQARVAAHVRQYRNPDEARRQLQRDARLRDQLAFEAMWAALVRWTLEHAKVAQQSLTLEQLQARGRA